MFSFFKRKDNNLEVPEWASFFNKTEYSEFIAAIEKYFYKKNVTYTIEDGALATGANDFGFGVLGLLNLAQNCKQNKPGNYKNIVAAHFDSMIRIYTQDKEFADIIGDFEKVKQYIAVRLYADDYIAHIGRENTVGKGLADGLYATLVFDQPESVATIKPDQADKWGKTYAELLDLGTQNIKNKYENYISKELFDDFELWVVTGEHFFTPNILLNMQDHPQLTGTYGSLVGVPHRHAVIMYPIESIEVVKVITNLIPTISGMYREGPGSLSPGLFWYKNGLLENLPYDIVDNTIQFKPTENFLEMLNSLGSEE